MGILGIIGTIIVGFIVGLIARAFMPGVDSMGFWLTSALGIGGSIVGGFIGGIFSKAPDGKFHPAGLDPVDHRRDGHSVGLQQLHALTLAATTGPDARIRDTASGRRCI